MSYVNNPNSFRQRLLAGETLIGSWCALANPTTTEVLGLAGSTGWCWMVNMHQTISPHLCRN